VVHGSNCAAEEKAGKGSFVKRTSMVLPILLTVISLGAIIARAQVTRCPDYNDDEYY